MFVKLLLHKLPLTIIFCSHGIFHVPDEAIFHLVHQISNLAHPKHKGPGVFVLVFLSLKSFMYHTKSTGLNFSSCLETTNTAHYFKDWREMIIAHNGMFMTLILRCSTLVSYFYYHLISSKHILASRCKFGNTATSIVLRYISGKLCILLFLARSAVLLVSVKSKLPFPTKMAVTLSDKDKFVFIKVLQSSLWVWSFSA